MTKTLVILAAGIGSRFGGGVKQLTPVDDNGHLIIDYSIHDAIAAGFNKIVFIIRHDIEADFRSVIGNRIEAIAAPLGVEIGYAFQELDDVPWTVPAGRTKPWGTGHAVLCAADQINSPFAVINADDYYGKEGFKKAEEFLTSNRYGLIGYPLKNTLSPHGGVTRGICEITIDGRLQGIKETRNIIKNGNYAEVNGERIDSASVVSMNFWCYPHSFLSYLELNFPAFLADMKDPLNDEYLLPTIADEMIINGFEYEVKLSYDKWSGMTYKDDIPGVKESFKKMIEAGIYKEDLYTDL